MKLKSELFVWVRKPGGVQVFLARVAALLIFARLLHAQSRSRKALAHWRTASWRRSLPQSSGGVTKGNDFQLADCTLSWGGDSQPAFEPSHEGSERLVRSSYLLISEITHSPKELQG